MRCETADDVSGPIVTDQTDNRLVELVDDFLVALDAGEEVNLDRAIRENPDLREPLERYLSTAIELHQTGQATQLAESPDCLLANLPDYLVHREIGRGGMGIVYEATQLSSQRKVALKTLPMTSMLDSKQRARFRNEIQAAQTLCHPNIVEVHSVHCDDALHFYCMELIDGQSLDRAIRQLIERFHQHHSTVAPSNDTVRMDASPTRFHVQRSHLSSDHVDASVRLIADACHAIHHAHQLGVVHRDLKPSNLMVDSNGRLRVTDFGLARIHDDSDLTKTGDTVGTLRYMSPEQAGGKTHEVDHRTDIYSLAATLYELISLHPAHDEDNHGRLRDQVMHDSPASLRRRNPAVSSDLEAVVNRAMELKREDRYESAQAFAQDLERVLDARPTIAKHPGLYASLSKRMDRHRGAVVLALAVLSFTACISTTAAMLIHHEKGLTEAAAEASANNLAESQRVVDVFGAMVDQELEHLPGSEPLRQKLLNELMQYYSSFVAEGKKDHRLKRNLASATLRLAVLEDRIGRVDQAETHYLEASRLFQALTNELPENESGHDDLRLDAALCQNNVGTWFAKTQRPDEAMDAFERSLALHDSLESTTAGLETTKLETRYQRGRSQAVMNLAICEADFGNRLDAVERLRQLLESLQEIDIRLDQPDHRHVIALCQNDLALLLFDTDHVEAETLLISSVETYDSLRQDTANSGRFNDDLAACLANLAALKGRKHEFDAACDIAFRVVTLHEEQTERHVFARGAWLELAIAQSSLGHYQQHSGREDEAATWYRRSHDLLVQLEGRFPKSERLQTCLEGVRLRLSQFEPAPGGKAALESMSVPEFTLAVTGEAR